MPTPLLLFLGIVAAIIILTGGLGVALAAAFYWLDLRVRHPSAPVPPMFGAAEAAAAVPATGAHRAAGPGAAVFALVILIAGVFVGLLVRLMPVEASGRAGQVDLLFHTMLGFAASIFLLVEGILVFLAFRFRRKKGEDGDGVPLHGSNRLEVAWTIMPSLIVLWLGIYSYQILTQIETPPSDALTVEVISRQFQWEFRYPEFDITSPDLYLPQDKPVRLKITSADVIHAFWVPAFRVKQDAVPRHEAEVFFTANKAGKYRVVCAELCGAGHARMGLISYVVVQSQSEFDKWVADQLAAAGGPPDPLALFAKYGCNACHTLTAAGATGLVGPSLDGIGTRAETRVSGQSAEDYVRESILNPNAFLVPECPAGACQPGVMPQDFGTRMPQSHLDALVKFLLEQK
jgi:cytochrome c oxidase subunit 2